VKAEELVAVCGGSRGTGEHCTDGDAPLSHFRLTKAAVHAGGLPVRAEATEERWRGKKEDDINLKKQVNDVWCPFVRSESQSESNGNGCVLTYTRGYQIHSCLAITNENCNVCDN
jgi:hypothetical protein